MLDPHSDLIDGGENNYVTEEKCCPCPRLKIKIMGKSVNALIDSGSELTCISECFYKNNVKLFENCPKLSVTGKTVRGAMDKKCKSIKMQLSFPIQVNDLISKDLIFLVVPDLNEDCILGIDMLVELKAIINTHKKNIKFVDYQGKVIIKSSTCSERISNLCQLYHENGEIVTECNAHSLRINKLNKLSVIENISMVECDNLNSSLSDLEIENKLLKCTEINDEQKTKLKNLICEFRHIFDKKPGLLNSSHLA